MKRSLSLLVLAVVFFAAWPARADELPETQLDFVRKLRARRFANLALEYLEKFKATAPPAMGPLLSLEIARTRVSLAQEKEPEQRAPLFAQAKVELEALIRAHGDRPEAAEARVEVARLAALNGKAVLDGALRQEAREAQIAGALKARQQFIAAGKELETAATQLEALQNKYANPTTDEQKAYKDQVGEAYLQILVDRGTNYLDQAETYIDEAKDKTIRERAEVIEEAKKMLTKVAELNEKSPHNAMARAWLVRCYQLTDAPKDALKQWNRLKSETAANAQAGRRLGWYFYIRGIERDPSVKKDKNKEIATEARGWLSAYGAYRNTHEGQGVRFELAKSLLTEAQVLGKGAAANKLFASAQKEFASLAATDSEFAQQANELSLAISVHRIKDVPLEKLTDFEDCFLKARYEVTLLQQSMNKLAKADEKEREKIEAERKQHLKTVVAAFGRALRLADGKTDTYKLADARYYLTFVYLMSGDPYRAAIMGEYAARSKPATRRTAMAAGYAIDAYASVLDAPNGNTEGNRARVRALAGFILKDNAKLWQNEPASMEARYQLAMINMREKKYAETINQLEQLPPEFGLYLLAQSQLAIFAMSASREAGNEDQKALYQDKALKALQRIPRLPPHASAATAQMFLTAQIEHFRLLYADAAIPLQKGQVPLAVKKFEALATFTTDLEKQFHQLDVKLGADSQEKWEVALASLKKAAQIGLADCEYRAGNYDKVLALTEDAVKTVKALDKGEGPITLKDYKVTGGMLGLNLRAKVQKGKIDEAKVLLPLLRRLQGEGELDNDATAVLQALVQELRIQVKTLQDKGDQMQLKKTVDNFSAFLEELSKQADTKGMQQNIFFLANCYGSLGKHDKAADLYKRIADPHADKSKKPDEKEVATYWFIQLQCAKELRLAKQFDEAKAVLDKVPPPFRSFTVQQEEVYQLEDRGLFGSAITRWGALMKSPYITKKFATDNEAKKLYFDCFYHVISCWNAYGKNHKVPAKQAEAIRRAADYILRMENAPSQDGWQIIGPRLRQLMEAEPMLKSKYEELKKTTK